MGKNFCDFKFNEQKISPNEKIDKSTNHEEKLKATYDDLKNLDSDSLAYKLAEEVKKQKEEGTFNFDLIKSSIESMRPFLTNETYINLKQILENLK